MKERVPLSCPNCQTDLKQPGTVIAWSELPEKMLGHIEQGDGGVILAVDQVERNPELILQCDDCGNLLELPVEDVFLDPECEILESGEQD